MICYIHRDGTPINDMTFDSIADAIAYARAPRWAGDKGQAITMITETSYKAMGLIYNIATGENPKAERAAARAALKARDHRAPARSAFDASGKFRGSAWLAREMDRADSDF